jgi:hypothetical protein
MKNVRKNIGNSTFFREIVLTGPRCGCIPFGGYKSKEVIINVHPCCGPGSVGWPPENVCPAKGSPMEPSLFSEMTREISLPMVLLSTNPGTRNPEREIGRVPPEK